jgi:hypothetical protein
MKRTHLLLGFALLTACSSGATPDIRDPTPSTPDEATGSSAPPSGGSGAGASTTAPSPTEPGAPRGTPSAVPPPPVSSSSAAAFAGAPAYVETLGPSTLDTSGKDWSPGPAGPPARRACAMAYDCARGAVVLFGGTGAGADAGRVELGDTSVLE